MGNNNKLSGIVGFIFNTRGLKKRDFGIDFIKSIAALFVLSVHFFLKNGYYNIPMTERNIMIPTAFRWIFFTGVPLFIISTGYLKRKSKFNGLHYVKITPIIVTTILVGVITVLYKILFLGESNPLFIWARSIWACEQPGYGWYVNMYLCLALIMPFLIYAWNAIESPRKKQMTIIVFAILTALPQTINRWPVMDTNLGFTPNRWTTCYAITYFLIGAYIGEYRPKIKKWVLGLLFACCIAYQTIKTYITANGENFYNGVCADYEDLITVLTGTILFLLIYDINVKNLPVRAIFASISSVTLGLYLLSWIGDNEIYPYFSYKGRLSNGVNGMLGSYFLIVPLNFTLCYIVATTLNIFTKLITSPIIRLVSRRTNKQDNLNNQINTPEKEIVTV